MDDIVMDDNPMDEEMDLDVVAFIAEEDAVVEVEDNNNNNNNNHDEAIQVGIPIRMIHERRRRRTLRIRMRGFQDDDDWMHDNNINNNNFGGNNNNNNNNNIPTSNSPFLLDLIREDLPCSQVLSGANVRGCSTIVLRVQEHPSEVHYQCPRTGRSPLHEAALRCACRHVFEAILNVDTALALHADTRHNTPLHLLFLGSRRLDDMEFIVDLLLHPFPHMIASMRNREGCLPLHCACSAPETMLPPATIQKLIQACPSSPARTNHQEQTPLHLHCKRRNASVLVAQKLIEAFPDALHFRDRPPAMGFTPLHYAAHNSNHALVQYIATFDPTTAGDTTMPTGKTPLHILCQQNPCGPEDLSSVRFLLQAAPHTASLAEHNTRFTPLHLLCRVTRPICLPIVQELVRENSAALSMHDCNDYLPLHHACENGADPRLIHCLLQAYPEGASVRTRKNDTALTLACVANHSVETVKFLLQANPDAVLQANDYGFLPLHCSCRAYQANTAIVQTLLKACPQALLKTTNAGESPIHLASNNAGASVGILDLLQRTLQSLRKTPLPPRERTLSACMVGNTPLHLACFRDFNRPHIESLAESNPEWINVRNNAGYSPLQILCKNGRIDDRIVTLFSRLCGPEIFASVDLMGNTPLHSAMREETDVEALRAIIRAYPEALHMKTSYDDTPLHLACLRRVRPEVVREVALASSMGLEVALANCNGRISPILIQNTAGQTPIGIALEEYQRLCTGTSCCVQADLSVGQMRCFITLASLAKMLHYGPSGDDNRGQSLVGACVALHRKGARIDPAFIQRALLLYPEEARIRDEHNNTPLHIEASIPVEKMSLLDSTAPACCEGACHKRMGVLRKLLEIYPEAAQLRNDQGDFCLNLMIQNGRPWDSSFALVIRTYPQALHYVPVDVKLLPRIFGRVSSHCGNDTIFTLLRTRPEFLVGR